MPKSTELEFIRTQLSEAKQLHSEAELARAIIESNDKTELEKAWQCGKRLNALKALQQHGNWITFIEGHWPQLPSSTRELYMKIDRENPNAQRVGDLTHDSIRKYAIAKVPKKSHPQQAGDQTFSKPQHHSTVVNEITRYFQRYDAGQIEANEDDLRRDFLETYKRLQKLFGDA